MQPRVVSLGAGPTPFNTIHAERRWPDRGADLRQNFVPECPSGVTFAVIDRLKALAWPWESWKELSPSRPLKKSLASGIVM